MFGSQVAQYRVELILAIILIVVSLPALLRSNVFKTRTGSGADGVGVRDLHVGSGGRSLGRRWSDALLLFIPNAFAYFLVYIHCSSKGKLQVLVLLMLFVCFFVIGEGAYELHQGLPQGSAAENADMSDTYFIGMDNAQGEWFYRLRGKGQINDPNDFAQIIVCSLPLTFFFWKRKRAVRNFFFVLVPVGVLIWGVYLTHSRGGMLGVLAIVIVAAPQKDRYSSRDCAGGASLRGRIGDELHWRKRYLHQRRRGSHRFMGRWPAVVEDSSGVRCRLRSNARLLWPHRSQHHCCLRCGAWILRTLLLVDVSVAQPQRCCGRCVQEESIPNERWLCLTPLTRSVPQS